MFVEKVTVLANNGSKHRTSSPKSTPQLSHEHAITSISDVLSNWRFVLIDNMFKVGI
jgi:hypothetical protein